MAPSLKWRLGFTTSFNRIKLIPHKYAEAHFPGDFRFCQVDSTNYHTNDRKFHEISRDLEGQINMGRSEILLEVCFKLGTQLLWSENAWDNIVYVYYNVNSVFSLQLSKFKIIPRWMRVSISRALYISDFYWSKFYARKSLGGAYIPCYLAFILWKSLIANPRWDDSSIWSDRARVDCSCGWHFGSNFHFFILPLLVC